MARPKAGSQITEQQKERIRKLHRVEGLTTTVLAERFGVSQSRIVQIIHEKEKANG